MAFQARYGVMVVAGTIALAAHYKLDRLVHEDELAARQRLILPAVETVRLACGGFDKLMSDLYWLAFVQYCGDVNTARGKDYSHAYDFVNLITGLDPYFSRPYWFGCWAVGYWQGRPDLAEKILQRGMNANPESWEMPYLAGINQYLFAKNYKLAAHYYRLAARQPGAPDFLLRHAQILESPLPEMVKRAHMLYRMYHDAHDMQYKSAVYKELLSTLEQMERKAPTELTRKGIRTQIQKLQNEYSNFAQ